MLRIAALAAIVVAILAPAATAGVTCSTDAAAEIAGATVNGPRAGWDPPVWTFDMPDLNASVDVQAYDLASARSKAQDWLAGQVSSACGVANPQPADPSAPSSPSAPSAPTPSPGQTEQAQAIVAAAAVTYVGNSWGPIPIWRVNFPALNLSVDVAANSADEARAAVVPFIAARLAGTPTQTPTEAGSPTATVPAKGGVVVVGEQPAPDTSPTLIPSVGHPVAA